MAQAMIDQLIINSPYEEPGRHWHYDQVTRQFDLKNGRRSAGYVIASPAAKAFDDPGAFVEIQLVNAIRARVAEWRGKGYPGVSGITRRLIDYWYNPEEFDERRFFFCQLEAAETLIWLLEAPEADKVGIEICSDGGAFKRRCAKMATGTGKTVVMAMVIAWQILNKVSYPRDTRFSKNVLVVAPGLTIKNRLAVLKPSHSENYYEVFRIVPPDLLEKLRQGKVAVKNWHALNWESEEKITQKRGVDKRGAKSDEAFVRDVLGDMASARGLLVINDEAHHAWRAKESFRAKGVNKNEIEQATKWIGGLDRIERARGITACYDFSATPFVPSGRQSSGEALFEWIVSDFGLNDAIESGLVKTPRVVIRDDALPNAATYESRLFHIYQDEDVKEDLNRKADPSDPLPDLVVNGFYLLGYDWKKTAEEWKARSAPSRPVMITVANRTETAARVKFSFDNGRIRIAELCDPKRTLHIDSKVLANAEATSTELDEFNSQASKSTKQEKAEQLRRQVNTVGVPGKEGADIQNVISVGMLSEGWDTKTVTHIMGLRAFSSQLLCEQVVGRGLRRTAYEAQPETGLFEPEYVNVFGVPFTFLPYESRPGTLPASSIPTTMIQPSPEKRQFEILWPNVIRIHHELRLSLSLDWNSARKLCLDAGTTAILAELAPVVDGKPDTSKIKTIELENLAREYRMQRIAFETARDVYGAMEPRWPGGRVAAIAQLIPLIEQFICSDKIEIHPREFETNELKRRLLITLEMNRLVRHIWQMLRCENIKSVEPVLDQSQPILSTGEMRPWHTRKPCKPALRSHINFCVCDSSWEASDAYVLDRAPEVEAWAKNDHLGFEIVYIFRGVVRKYRPDFLIRLKSGRMLILETKGVETEQDRVKQEFLKEWVRAVNSHGGFGQWSCDVARQPGEIRSILAACRS